MEQLGFDLDAVNEEWRPVPDFPDYEVSDRGRMRSIPRLIWRMNRHGQLGQFYLKGCVLKQHPGSSGYQQVVLRRDGTSYNMLVHKAVLTAFTGTPPLNHEACHWNGNKSDNRWKNLIWGTKNENAKHRQHCGTYGRTLNEEQACQIKERLNSGTYRTFASLAAEFGVWTQAVSHIAKGKTWAWL